MLEGIDVELCNFEQICYQCDEQVLVQCECIFQCKFDQQVLVLSVEQLLVLVEKVGFVLQDVINSLFEEVCISDWEQVVYQIDGCMCCLELVNFVVIQEYGEVLQCLEYLDVQNIDLIIVLEILEEVICKIDCEICGCFKDIFDWVNVGVQQLYLCLFGGGYVYFELIGEDFFDMGVMIMVCLLGKCVFSILLLFGGEKVMMVVVLVFVIFQFNLVLFCLLDEVDVLLDEVNVGCLVNMVKEMSEKVQFLFVSYNKVMMEVVYQLFGVIMCELGVS